MGLELGLPVAHGAQHLAGATGLFDPGGLERGERRGFLLADPHA